MNIDKLERLNRLRLDGALSEADYETAKAALLHGAIPKRSRASGKVIVGVALCLVACLLVFLIFRPQSPSGLAHDGLQDARAADVSADEGELSTEGGLLSGDSEKLTSRKDRLLVASIIGGNITYFDSIAGPPTHIYGTSRHYSIDGCEVMIDVSAGAISRLTYNLSSQCNPSGFGHRFGGMTLSQAEALFSGARYAPGCLTMCGNAADPTYDLVVAGSRSNGFVDYTFSSLAEEYDALDAWRERMIAEHGEDYVINESYRCDPKEARSAREATKNFKIVTVTVSSDSNIHQCR
jgi:hypothetical protein